MNEAIVSTQNINDTGNLCEDTNTKGFDLQAGQSWIYPTNYPVREYQHSITEQALYNNTLVSLPTGLGKTFIAAVVMFNFYRWYPYGKIIFMAPTRPLVKQQMDACYDIMAIPQETTAELTGTKTQLSRKEIWQNKRVFFITPQVLQNDLAIILQLACQVKCLVFDEAHRAKGNHAYCEVIRKLGNNKLFRVLALSATPGNTAKDVLDVMQNLLISHLEFRSEESPDVKPYVFERSLETVVVPLGEKLEHIKNEYLKILEKYTRSLIKYKVINGNYGNLTKGKIFMTMKEFQARNSGNRVPNYGEIMKSLNICVTLYHAYETLIRCGLRAFLNFFEEHISNPLLNGNTAILEIMENLRTYLGPAPKVDMLPDGTYAPIPHDAKFGHPKFYQLEDILVSHFRNTDGSSRVIVFFEYRESVQEAYALLSKSRPLIKARIFVGQGSGVTQKDQINTVKAFRDGTCNTLLSTCIGEEGLDVGEVDLIVCFDIANKSPIRMIQRMGRTGRKKEGRIVVLVTEGKEQQTLKDCLIYKNNLGNFVMNSPQLEEGKYKNNPPMIPSYIQPKCQKMFITVKKAKLSKNSNLKDMLKCMSSNEPKFDEDLEIVEIQEKIKHNIENLWDKNEPLLHDFEKPKILFSKHLEKQRNFQNGGNIKPSKQTNIMVSLLQFADSKRFNIPVTETFDKFTKLTQNDKQLKQGDIRSMFSKATTTSLYEGEYTSIPLSQIQNFEKEKDITQSFPEAFFTELSNYLAIQETMDDNCKTCNFLFQCPKIDRCQHDLIDLSTCVIPDLSILDGITSNDWNVFGTSLSPESKKLYNVLDDDTFEDVDFSQLEDVSNKDETPRNFNKILESFRITNDWETTTTHEECDEKSFAFETPKGFGKILSRLKVSVQEIEEIPERHLTICDSRDVLAFFKVTTIEELYEESDLDKTIVYTPIDDPQDIKTKSTDIIEASPDLFSCSDESRRSSVIIEDPESPVFSSFSRTQQLKAKKKLFEIPKNESCFKSDEIVKKPNLSSLKLTHKSFYESKKTKPESPKKIATFTDLDIADICDLSQFGLNKRVLSEKSSDTNKNIATPEKDLDISDVCDLSIFMLSGNDTKTTDQNAQVNRPKRQQTQDNSPSIKIKRTPVKKIIQKESSVGDFTQDGGSRSSKIAKKTPQKTVKSVKKGLGKEPSIDDFCDFSNFFGSPIPKVNSDKKQEQIASLEDFCDLSFLSPKKDIAVNNGTQREEKLVQTVIDLTDSDFENSPKKLNKVISQMSITQMLSCISKESASSNSSQKDNSSSVLTPSVRKGTQKSILSLSAKKKKDVLSQTLISPKPNTTQQAKKNLLQISVAENSDDEFEDMCKSPNFRRHRLSPVLTKKSKLSLNKKPPEKLSGENIKEGKAMSSSPLFAKPSKVRKKKSKKLFCEFLEEEAEVSDDGLLVSEDEDSGEDRFEESFVNDETQDLNATTMHARYLQSVRSPSVRGKFKIPLKPKHDITNVFSQEVSNVDDNYVNDSFCVNSQDIDCEDQHDLSELEILEMKLKETKKSKKRKRSEEKTSAKRRRIVVIEDSD